METKTEECQVMFAEPQKEHQWLQKFVGEWTAEGEAAEPGKPPEKFGGTESVRSIGGLWILAEGHGQMPGGGEATMFTTIGYDPQKQRYLGTFVGSMMTHLWIYEGTVDDAGTTLTLNAQGPDMTTEGKMAHYRDVWEFKGNDERVLTSYMLNDEGEWQQFMTATYRRKN